MGLMWRTAGRQGQGGSELQFSMNGFFHQVWKAPAKHLQIFDKLLLDKINPD